MALIQFTPEEARTSRETREFCRHAAFLTDAWPGDDRERAAEELLSGLEAGHPLLAQGEAGELAWLAGLSPLAFDSMVFGWSMHRLHPLLHREAWPGPEALAGGREFLAAVLAAAGTRGAEFLMARVPARDFLAAQVLETAGFRLMDASVEWLVELGGEPERHPLPPRFVIRAWRPEDEEPLADLAAGCLCDLDSYADRFALDPRLRGGCGELYRRWLKNSLVGEQADQVLVLAEMDTPVGFITLKLPPAAEGPAAHCGWVVLNAVAPAYRGRGLYHQLLARGLAWLLRQGAQRARVRTKLSQAAVIRAFARLGGRQVHADYTFHLWLGATREQS